jgi:hypothetical protein
VACAGRGTAGPSIKVCPKCFAAQLPGASSCKFCGAKFETQSRVIDEVAGELVEIDIEKMRQQTLTKTERDESSLEFLTALGVKRGYKNPRGWAKHVFNARQAEKLAKGRVP